MPPTQELCWLLPFVPLLYSLTPFCFAFGCLWGRVYMERMYWPEAPSASVMSAQSLCLPLLVYTWLCEVHLCLGALVTLSLPQEWRLPWTCVGRS